MLEIHQIYYKPKQIERCDYTPYLNENCTIYFENEVISDLVKKSNSEYFGVVSWNLRSKIKSVLGPRINISKFEPLSFSNKLKLLKPDVMAFCQYSPHDPINNWNEIHSKLKIYFERILKACGHDWHSKIYEHCFYSNAFVAKTKIYQDYVRSLLDPAIAVMDGMPELMCDSGYPFPLPSNLVDKWQISHYPYHSFICERLFSFWCYLNKLNVKYY